MIDHVHDLCDGIRLLFDLFIDSILDVENSMRRGGSPVACLTFAVDVIC